jgi:hypothetical protein
LLVSSASPDNLAAKRLPEEDVEQADVEFAGGEWNQADHRYGPPTSTQDPTGDDQRHTGKDPDGPTGS